MNFNLIATTYRNMENRLIEELEELLPDEKIIFTRTRISGLVLCLTESDPYKIVEKVKDIVKEYPWRIRFVLRLIPIDLVTNTELDEISEEAIKLAEKIKEDE
ncbi:MAG: hypothetical protein D6752_07100, partial [Candidatus Nitrosothermus koennekii]